MKPALNENDTAVPAAWQQFPQGGAMSAAISEQLKPFWQQIFGYYLLKVGDLSCQLDTRECKTRYQLNLGQHDKHSDLLAEPDVLPVREHSVDAVLLSHLLEFAADPHHIVREAHRVLMPDGYLLLSGINPTGIVGALRYLPWLQRRYPWSGHFFPASRIKDWLHLVGFEVLAERRFFCSALLAKEYQRSRWGNWKEKYFGYFGACYVLVARKRELPLVPIRPGWRLTPEFNPAIKEVRVRQGGASPDISGTAL